MVYIKIKNNHNYTEPNVNDNLYSCCENQAKQSRVVVLVIIVRSEDRSYTHNY